MAKAAAKPEGEPVPKVYGAIVEVMSGLVEAGGIAKGRKNREQGYDFRGIDDVYNVLSKLLVAHRLVILPRVLSRKCYKRLTRNNTFQYNVVLQVDLDFISAEDGSLHTVTTFGEASDMADKATNKAMSAAYKYAIIEAFCIPIEVPDADESTPPETVDPAAMQRPGTGSSKPPGAAAPAAGKSAAKTAAQPTGQQQNMEAAKQAAAAAGSTTTGTASGMLTAEEVAAITTKITACSSETEICSIAKKFVATAAPKQGLPKVSKATAKELAKSISAKRATLTTADSYQDYADMVAAFCDREWLGKAEAEIYLSNAREN